MYLRKLVKDLNLSMQWNDFNQAWQNVIYGIGTKCLTKVSQTNKNITFEIMEAMIFAWICSNFVQVYIL